MADNHQVAIDRAKGVQAGLEAQRNSLKSNGGSASDIAALDRQISSAKSDVAKAEGERTASLARARQI